MVGIGEWLREIGLERYLRAFEENDIDTQILADLNEVDLEKLGIASLGHRKRLMKAISVLQEQSKEPEDPASRGERRQLTILFVDLVGSTAMSERMDPEQFTELNRQYHQAATSAIENHQGLVAKYLGDGLLAYFGYPKAQRGIHRNRGECTSHARFS